MSGYDLEATNTLERPEAVVPRDGVGAGIDDGKLMLRLPPYSYQMVRVRA